MYLLKKNYENAMAMVEVWQLEYISKVQKSLKTTKYTISISGEAPEESIRDEIGAWLFWKEGCLYPIVTL